MKDYSILRQNMIDGQIHPAGIISEDILRVFGEVPREEFVPDQLKPVSYHDEDLKLDNQNFLMEPIIHSKLIQAANLKPDHSVLDIGFGCGYSTAILSQLVSTVFAMDHESALATQAQVVWNNLKYCNIVTSLGDISEGLPSSAPYSRIFINGAVSELPEKLIGQLEEGGELLCILRESPKSYGKAVAVRKNKGENYSVRTLFDAGTPYLHGFEPKAAFVF